MPQSTTVLLRIRSSFQAELQDLKQPSSILIGPTSSAPQIWFIFPQAARSAPATGADQICSRPVHPLRLGSPKRHPSIVGAGVQGFYGTLGKARRCTPSLPAPAGRRQRSSRPGRWARSFPQGIACKQTSTWQTSTSAKSHPGNRQRQKGGRVRTGVRSELHADYKWSGNKLFQRTGASAASTWEPTMSTWISSSALPLSHLLKGRVRGVRQ